MNQATIREVMEILQKGYGDNSTTPLDRVVATNVVRYFFEKGWIDSHGIAILAESAGGEIRVPESLVEDDDLFLYRYTNPMTGEIVFKSRKKSEVNGKVNPDAETPRVVHSGPIEMRMTNDRSSDDS